MEGLRIPKEPFPEILGQAPAKAAVLSTILAGRHLVIMGYPGVGKTTLARSAASMLPDIRVVKGCQFNCDPAEPVCPACLRRKEKLESVISKGASRFIRVQGSPDLQVEDLLGDIDPIKALEFGPQDPRSFTPGKILRAHRGVLFFDEINRCPERLQNALLQVLEEGRATVGGYEVDYPTDFLLIATMNPKESAGTEKLSEALLDRFDMVEMTYPEDDATERAIVMGKAAKFPGVAVPDDICRRMVSIVRATRGDERIERPAGVRATIGLYERAQTNALVAGRKRATVEDLTAVVRSVLAHRIKLTPKFKHTTDAEAVVDSIVKAELSKTPPNPPPGKEEDSEQPPPHFSENDSPPPKKPSDNFGPLLRQMYNRGMGGVSAVFVARAIVFDLSSAIGTFGEDILEGLTGLPLAVLSRMEGKIEKVAGLSDRIDEKLKQMMRDGYMVKDGGGLSRKALEAAAEETLKDELQLLSKLGFGSHSADSTGHDEKSDLALPFAKGHTYRRISVRKTVSRAVRRGHSRPLPGDLQSVEMTRKSGVDFVFVLDSSGSMRGDKMDSCKRAAIGLAAVSAGSSDLVAVVAFRKEPEVICDFSDSEDLPLFAEKIVALAPGGLTSIGKALSLSSGMLTDLRSRSARHIILITDALPTEGDQPAEDARTEAAKAAAAGITISIVGISLTEEGETLARQLAGIGGGNFYNVASGGAAGELTAVVLDDRQAMRGDKAPAAPA